MIKQHALALAWALALDFILGDIEKWPHPIRWVGHAYEVAEKHFKQRGSFTVQGGVITVGTIGFLAAFIPFIILFLVPRGWIHVGVEGFLLYWCLSIRNLSDEALKVLKALKKKNLLQARQFLARIVGRDTRTLSTSEVSRAVIETIGESFVDGFLSTVFWGLLLGASGAFFFKAVSTGDSMIGHPEEPYRQFGWAAAKLDDLLNWIPARLCPIFLVPAAFILGQSNLGLLEVFNQDRLKHLSPNAAHGESAFAGALGVRLGGANYYQGQLYRQAFLNAWGRLCRPADIFRAILLLWMAAILVFLFLWVLIY